MPESTWTVTTRRPGPSRCASRTATSRFAPVDGPLKTPSSRTARRALPKASAVETACTSSNDPAPYPEAESRKIWQDYSFSPLALR